MKWALIGVLTSQLLMANSQRLVGLCVKALSTFDPASTGVEDHLKRFWEMPDSDVCAGGGRWLLPEQQGQELPEIRHTSLQWYGL